MKMLFCQGKDLKVCSPTLTGDQTPIMVVMQKRVSLFFSQVSEIWPQAALSVQESL